MDTFRGAIEVANPRLGVRRAVEAAQRAYPGRRWRSIVVVLEREDADEPVAAQAV